MEKTKKLPKWVEKRYISLWDQWRDHPFYFEDAARSSGEKKERLSVILSELKEAGLLKVEDVDPNDARKRTYKLVDILAVGPSESDTRQIEEALWSAAELVRYRWGFEGCELIIALLFLKKVGENEALVKREVKDSAQYSFDLPNELLWENLSNVHNPSALILRALQTIAKSDGFHGVFDINQFDRFLRAEHDEVLGRLIALFNTFHLRDDSPTDLANVYEFLLAKCFADRLTSANYTPREINKLLVDLLDPQPGQSIYDPACGTGGTLIAAHSHATGAHEKKGVDHTSLYGQELVPSIATVASMNLYVHGIWNFSLSTGDTLIAPHFTDEGTLRTFDIALSSLPWNARNYEEERLRMSKYWSQRFTYGYPSRTSADWAWIQHTLASIKYRGRAGLILDTGCLFRGGKEGAIRSEMLRDGLIEAVIMLPRKLFVGTSASGVVLLLRKQEAARGRGAKILFIDASHSFKTEGKGMNRLTDAQIEKIVSTYKEFREEKGFSKVVTLEEVAQNNFNLNVALYVTTARPTEEIDLRKEFSRVKKLTEQRLELEQEFAHDVIESEKHVLADKAAQDELPQGWQTVKLKDVAMLEHGKKLPERERREGSYPVYGSSGKIGYHNKFLEQGPGIVIGRVGNTGRITWVDEDFWPIDTVYYVKPVTSVDLKWLYYALSSLNLVSLSTSTIVPHLNRKLAYEVQLDVPPLDEQKKIAHKLSLIDEMQKNDREREEVLQRVKRGLMSELLTGGVRYGE